MKNVKKDLQALTKQLKALTAKLEKIEKAVGKEPAKKAAPKKAAGKKAPAAKTARKKADSGSMTAIDTVVGLIRRSKNGIDIAAIKKKTDFSDKQISNLLYKAKKKGLVKSLGKGVYGKSDPE